MNIVFSKHARERMEQRIISEEMVLATVQMPDRTYPEADGDTKFIRKVYRGKVHVICKPLPEENKWMVKSVWIRGEDDFGRPTHHKRYLSKRPSTAAPGGSVNLWLFLVLIVLVTILYLLTR